MLVVINHGIAHVSNSQTMTGPSKGVSASRYSTSNGDFVSGCHSAQNDNANTINRLKGKFQGPQGVVSSHMCSA